MAMQELVAYLKSRTPEKGMEAIIFYSESFERFGWNPCAPTKKGVLAKIAEDSREDQDFYTPLIPLFLIIDGKIVSLKEFLE